ncbi:MAG: insulinase family protein [Deltaproteobacteria bacterium]|nr:insulinase family protein [Deltaproteobacteria bacterium]
MRLRHRAALTLITFFLFLGSIAWAEPGRPFKTRLDNGLTVIIEEEHSAPVVSVQMWVRVGGADETDREAGISHVFEHMLFKGTARKKVGEIASIVESVGGDINAYTSFDNTVFHLTVPSRHFSTGLDIVSDAIQNSSFEPNELKKELEVVLEEIRMNEDDPGRKLYRSLLGTAFKVHPYRRPVIGYQKTVKSFTREQIIAFFRKWYIPNNMTLVVAGDVDRAAALKEIKKEFASFEKKPDPHRKRPVEPPQKDLRADAASMQIKEAHLGMSFHIPELKNPDTFALDVLQVVLSGGETSRLYKKLKLEDQLVYSISAYPMSLKNPGLFFVTATLESKDIDKTVTEALHEIDRLKSEGPDHEELQKAKFNLESEFIFSRETMDGIASKIGYYETNLNDPEYEKVYIEGIRKVTPDDIKRVAAKYFSDGNITINAVLPKADKDVVTKASLASAVRASLEKEKEMALSGEAEGKTTKVRLDNGITLIVKEVHANPTVAFYATFPGGLRFEESAKDGIGSFTAGMLTRGTAKRTREELANEVEEMAGAIGGFSGWNSTGVSGKFLSMSFEKGLSMMADVMLQPAFPEDEIEKLRKDTIAAIKRQEDYLPGYTFKLLYRELYKVHPYGMPVIGTVESVSSFKRDDLVSHWEEFFVPERMVFTVVGDVKTDYAIERVNKLFGGFKRASGPLAAPPQEEHQKEVRMTGDTKEKEQTHMGIGFLGATMGDEDSYALKVMTEVLSGQGGRLFVNLRDMKSLAYSVSAVDKEGKDKGVFAVYIAAAPDKKDEAIAGIMKELKDISAEKVTAAELKRAKNSIIGGYEIGLQEVSSQAADMANNELYGLGYEFYREFPKKIEAVTEDDVLRAAQKYLTLDAYTISIVGPNGLSLPAKQ